MDILKELKEQIQKISDESHLRIDTIKVDWIDTSSHRDKNSFRIYKIDIALTSSDDT